MAQEKKRGKRGNPSPNIENLKRFGIEKPPNTHERAVETGRMGGLTAAKNREIGITMDQAFMSVMGKKVTGDIKRVLESNGYNTDELNNAHAIFATLISLAILDGDMQAIKILTDYSISLREEARKSEESKARIETMRNNGGADMGVKSQDDDDGGVLIYLPQIEDDEEEVEQSTETDE